MGFEYQLRCEPHDNEQIQDTIVDVLKSDSAYRLLENDKQITFQFTDSPQSSNWPDVIIVESERVYIVIYSSHPNHHVRFLAQIKEALTDKEIVTTLEEI